MAQATEPTTKMQHSQYLKRSSRYPVPERVPALHRYSSNPSDRKIILVTCKHTGTHFFSYMMCPDESIHCDHNGYREVVEKRIAAGWLVVTTEREWHKVISSHIRRHGMETLADHFRGKAEWDEWVLPRADIVLSVDADDREARLSKLTELTGVEYETDWVPRNRSIILFADEDDPGDAKRVTRVGHRRWR